jgi:tetratricopeptide (TPR) repeat protein
LGDRPTAIECYDRTIAIDHTGFWGWCKRADLLRQLGQLEAAITSYDQAIAIDPYDSVLWYNRACCFALGGNSSAAIGSLQQSYICNPTTTRTSILSDRDLDPIRTTPEFTTWLKTNPMSEQPRDPDASF